MDALALLCNLHADGPATFQRLRRLGCESIEEVGQLEDEQLGSELQQGRAGAQRFKREAHNLMVRQQGGTPLPAPEDEALDDTKQEGSGTAEPAAEEASEPAPRPKGMAHVLEAWRKMDEESPPEQPTSYRGPQAEPEAAHSGEFGLEDVESLTPAMITRLGELGIRTPAALVKTPSMRLCQDMPLPLTRVKRLQLLAGRLGTPRAAAVVQPEPRASEPEPQAELAPPEIRGKRAAVQAFGAPEVASEEPEAEPLLPQAAPPVELKLGLGRKRRAEELGPPAAEPESKDPEGLREEPQEEAFGWRARELQAEDDSDLDRLDSSGPFA